MNWRWLVWGALSAGGAYLVWRSISAAQAALPPASGALPLPQLVPGNLPPVSTMDFDPAPAPGAALDAVSGNPVQSVSPAGLLAIQGHEGLKLTAYPDANGYSIGYGHFGAIAGQTITQDQADAYFASDIQSVEDAINGVVTVPLSQGQYDALADFVFNVGVNAFKGSTLLKLLNAGNYSGAAAQFAAWKYSGGQVSASLVARRADETAEFES